MFQQASQKLYNQNKGLLLKNQRKRVQDKEKTQNKLENEKPNQKLALLTTQRAKNPCGGNKLMREKKKVPELQTK